MLTAVELDDEFCGVTDKVGDVLFDRDLAAKADPTQSVVAQLGPKGSFDVSRISAQSACIGPEPSGYFPAWILLLGHSSLPRRNAPTPALPRKRGRESHLSRR